ncbi:hypothetical protein EVAR_19708_1 [Eumeta japonica]|uniref:Uncharacterized protein n=1 Tax=Eumeta variegata TaxID=151549 RepID=A0A4C1URM4_EUMVA|nr:hypothetical protein EVAR_19708_1 [Eumeta japonica]
MNGRYKCPGDTYAQTNNVNNNLANCQHVTYTRPGGVVPRALKGVPHFVVSVDILYHRAKRLPCRVSKKRDACDVAIPGRGGGARTLH